MNILITGESQIKFTFLGRHLGTIKRAIRENIPVQNPDLAFKRNIDLPGDLDLVLEVKTVYADNEAKLVAQVHVTLFGMPIFTHTENITGLSGIKQVKVPEFNRFGIKVTNLLVSLSA